jgi:ribosome biogenesis protein Nip4
MKEILEFVSQFNASIPLDKSKIVKKRNRYYMLSKALKKQAPKGFFYAGTYLGAVKGASFFPSFLLLQMMAQQKANKLVVDNKTAWLFICGRDIFKKGITKDNNLKKGEFALILNQNGECLGFGKMVINLRGEIDLNKTAVKNILDVGDFLRREKNQTRKQPKIIKIPNRSRRPRRESNRY